MHSAQVQITTTSVSSSYPDRASRGAQVTQRFPSCNGELVSRDFGKRTANEEVKLFTKSKQISLELCLTSFIAHKSFVRSLSGPRCHRADVYLVDFAKRVSNFSH